MRRGSIQAIRAASLLLVLAGCHMAPQATDTPAIKAAGDQMRAIYKDCKERRLAGEFRSLEQSEACAGAPVIAAYEAAHYPYMDLIRFAEAARMAGAAKVDSGEISEAEYDRQRLRLRDRLADEIDRRNAAAAKAASPPVGELDAATKAKMLRGLSAFAALEP